MPRSRFYQKLTVSEKKMAPMLSPHRGASALPSATSWKRAALIPSAVNSA